MKNIIAFIFCCLVYGTNVYAQQKNFVKINVVDCINCISSLSKILEKDQNITFIIQEGYAADSNDVIEKFSLGPYRKQIIWSTKLYDSLSQKIESELIQFCAGQEIGRSSLKKVIYKNCASNDICLSGMSSQIIFFDYKNYMLISNTISDKQYIYWKNKKVLTPVTIDSALVKSIYVDFIKDTKLYDLYIHMTTVAALFKPKVVSLCPYNDSTVLGCMVTYKVDSITSVDTFFQKMASILEIGQNKPSKISFINETLPIPFHSLNYEIHSSNGYLYFPLLGYENELLINKQAFKTLAKFKKQKSVYQTDKVMSSNLNDYLIRNQIFNNYNRSYIDNGYSLMSLSNYIINLETEEKIYLPINDSVFKNIWINPKNMDINYSVYDFKYNQQEGKFYIRYSWKGFVYVASFKPKSDTFDSNDILYSLDNQFSYDINSCLSWDGKGIIYCMQNENCFKYVTVSQLQEIAKNYKKAE